MTELDTAVNLFFTYAGTDFIATIFAIPIISIIVISFIRPFDV